MTPLELRDLVTAGEVVAPDDLMQFISQHQEGQHLDYKSGKLVSGDGPGLLRRHVSGLANAEGGLLILGVANDRSIDGITAKGGGRLQDWLMRCLQPLAGHFTVPPHIEVVVIGGRNVAIMSVERNGTLIPVSEEGLLKYYVRLGESTRPSPDFLISDLLLGRRQVPRLRLSVDQTRQSPGGGGLQNISVTVDIFNEGSIWVEEMRLGAVFLSATEDSDRQPMKLPQALQSYLSVKPAEHGWYKHFLACSSVTVAGLAPLDSSLGNILSGFKIPVMVFQGWKIQVTFAAIFCIPRNGPIQWYELQLGLAQSQYAGLGFFRPQIRSVHSGLVRVGHYEARVDRPDVGMRFDSEPNWNDLLVKDKEET